MDPNRNDLLALDVSHMPPTEQSALHAAKMELLDLGFKWKHGARSRAKTVRNMQAVSLPTESK